MKRIASVVLSVARVLVCIIFVAAAIAALIALAKQAMPPLE